MNVSTILTLLSFALYGVHIGVIPSISDSYRTIKNKSVYHIFFAVTSLLILSQAAYNYRYPWMFPIAAFFFWLISLAPQFWKSGAGKGYHVVFTYLAIGLGMACIIVQFWGTWLWVPSVVGLAGGGYLIKRYLTNPTLWAEYAAVCAIFIPILWKP